ncbi:kelch-like protein 41 isoform X2 [Ruditapes philippinarum]|nr:kelch-like protein 41 isoform X2 [Ruditapes philippinarum]
MDDYRDYLLENLKKMFEGQVLTDVTLQVGEVRIDCHRNVLAAASPYFRAMFINPVIEREADIIEIHNIPSHILNPVVTYIYSGNITLNNENVQDFLMTATMLELTYLIECCANYMMREVCKENCVEMFTFASHFACSKLKQHTKKFILDKFSDIFPDENLFELEIDDFEELIASDDISVEHEEIIFDAIKKWRDRKDSRFCLFPRLFKHVRLPLVSDEYFKTNIEQENFIVNDPVCADILSKFRKFNLTDSSVSSQTKQDYFGINAKPRHGMFNRNMIIFSGGTVDKNGRSLTAFDPITLKNYIGIKPHPTFDFKYKIDFYQLVTTADNSLYFIGGIFYDDHHFEDAGQALSEVYKYDSKVVCWERKTDMSKPRCCLSAAVLDNTVFVIGGKSKYPRGPPLDSVEFYDVENDIWNSLSSVPIGIYNHASAVVDGAILVFGGRDEDEDYLDTVLRYDIQKDFWTLVSTQMNKPRAQLCAFPYKSRIYLVGGITMHENILTTAIYDPSMNKWTYGENFPEERKITSAGSHDGIIYVCGGVRHLGLSGRRSRLVESRDLYKYDIEKNKWSKVVKLVQYSNTQSIACCVLNTKYLDESEYVSSP